MDYFSEVAKKRKEVGLDDIYNLDYAFCRDCRNRIYFLSNECPKTCPHCDINDPCEDPKKLSQQELLEKLNDAFSYRMKKYNLKEFSLNANIVDIENFFLELVKQRDDHVLDYLERKYIREWVRRIDDTNFLAMCPSDTKLVQLIITLNNTDGVYYIDKIGYFDKIGYNDLSYYNIAGCRPNKFNKKAIVFYYSTIYEAEKQVYLDFYLKKDTIKYTAEILLYPYITKLKEFIEVIPFKFGYIYNALAFQLKTYKLLCEFVKNFEIENNLENSNIEIKVCNEKEILVIRQNVFATIVINLEQTRDSDFFRFGYISYGIISTEDDSSVSQRKMKYDAGSLSSIKLKSTKASVTGRAIAGGILAGTTGAIVGAASAIEHNNKSTVSRDSNPKETCFTYVQADDLKLPTGDSYCTIRNVRCLGEVLEILKRNVNEKSIYVSHILVEFVKNELFDYDIFLDKDKYLENINDYNERIEECLENNMQQIIEGYWEENIEEKKEIEKMKKKYIRKIALLENKINNIPEQEELEKIQKEISFNQQEKEKLGLFKILDKKVLKDKINELTNEEEEIQQKIDIQIENYQNELEGVKEYLKEIEDELNIVF